MEKVGQLKESLLVVADTIEKQIEDEIERMDSLRVTELEQLREERLKSLKKELEQKRSWQQIGHGTYSELPEEKSFFTVMKESERVVCHFYQDCSPRCKIVDMHLKALAPLHIETRFVSLCAPKCPFLTEKLRIKVLPTILIVKDQNVVDRIVGFTDLGNRDDFNTSMLEWRLAVGQAINYDGDVRKIPDVDKPRKMNILRKKPKSAIRGRDDNEDSDDDLDL